MSQKDAILTWWTTLDEVTSRRVLHLHPDESLSDDIALDLQLAGVDITALGSYAQDDGDVYVVWGQPQPLRELLEAERANPPRRSR